MDPHPFDEYPTVPGICRECDLPKANRTAHPLEAGASTGPAPLANMLRPLRFHDRRTSLNAGLKAAPRSATVKGQVLAVIARTPRDRGVTDAELGHALMKVKENTLRPRRIDLVEEGWIEPARDAAGNEVTRGGFTAWTLTDAAYHRLRDPAA